MNPCGCTERHDARRIVLTGGPGAGKTAVLELIRLFFCVHVRTLPESAGIVFGGGFPRNERAEVRRASQRAIFHVQRQLEATETPERAAVVLCDRGTVDGAAYWPGPGDLFAEVGTTREQELARYHSVIHLRTPSSPEAYPSENPLRIETHAEAAIIDERIARLWAGHPRLFEVKATPDFLAKAAEALQTLRDAIPDCCRGSVKPFLWRHSPAVPERASGS
jgi:predicted ATPase